MKLVMMLENAFGNVRTDHRAETITFTERGSGHSHFFIVRDKERTEGHSLTKESSSQSFLPIFHSSIMNMAFSCAHREGR